jgi:hemoglobin
MKQSIYEAAGGHQSFVALARAWHARCLADPIVSHAFSHGYHPRHSERLAAYWAEALGGPADYTNSLGDQSAVVRMHSGTLTTPCFRSMSDSMSTICSEGRKPVKNRNSS